MSVKKQVYKLILTDSVVQELIQNGGGEVRVNTALFPDLNTIDQEFWMYHTPYGLPGDELIILEDYAIREVSQTSDGFYTIIEYKDGTRIKKQSRTPASITPKGCWLNANTMPTCFSRINALVQDINMSVDNSQWIYTISQTNLATIELGWSLGGDCGCLTGVPPIIGGNNDNMGSSIITNPNSNCCPNINNY